MLLFVFIRFQSQHDVGFCKPVANVGTISSVICRRAILAISGDGNR